jgi:hypothetical protein
MTLLNLSRAADSQFRAVSSFMAAGGGGTGGWVLLLGVGKSKILGACSMLPNLLGFRVSCMCYAE